MCIQRRVTAACPIRQTTLSSASCCLDLGRDSSGITTARPYQPTTNLDTLSSSTVTCWWCWLVCSRLLGVLALSRTSSYAHTLASSSAGAGQEMEDTLNIIIIRFLYILNDTSLRFRVIIEKMVQFPTISCRTSCNFICTTHVDRGWTQA